MVFNDLIDGYEGKACVISVDIFSDGKYGNIRIVAANQAHADEVQRVWGRGFEAGSPYEMNFPKNLNFEDDCYKSAVLGQELHSYSDVKEFGVWAELYFLPLKSDIPNKGYCLFSYKLSHKPNAYIRADVEPEVASAVLASFIKLYGENDFKECIMEVLKDLRDISDARRCCILLMDTETEECSTLADSIRENAPDSPTGESSSKNFYKIAVTWEKLLSGSNSLIIKNEQDMQVVKEGTPDWYASLQRASVKTLALFQLRYNEQLLGYIWASNFDVDNLAKVKGILELSTFFIAGRIANHQLMKKLETLSAIDLLTGQRNRNSMNNRITEFTSKNYIKPKALGIVFADVNGLKRVNDTMGHDAGDLLLKKAAKLLNQVFFKDEIYRAGGDEFMIISENCTRENMEEKVEMFRKLCDSDPDVDFSVGWCFDDTDMDILKDMSLADSRMYQDKELYYKKNPDKKWR